MVVLCCCNDEPVDWAFPEGTAEMIERIAFEYVRPTAVVCVSHLPPPASHQAPARKHVHHIFAVDALNNNNKSS